MMADAYIHPDARVESASIGAGTRIWAFTQVMQGASIGAHCNIGSHCFIEAGAVLGDNVTVKNGNMVWEGVQLADGVFVGPQVVFTNDRRPRSPRAPQAAHRYRNRDWLRPTVVQHGASLGAGAVLLAGVTVGAFAMVGAGALVTCDVPAYALVVGSPAMVKGWVCACGTSLTFQDATARCAECGLRFLRQEDGVRPEPQPATAASPAPAPA